MLSSDDVEIWLYRLASEPRLLAESDRDGTRASRRDRRRGPDLVGGDVDVRAGTCLVSEADILDGMVAGLR